MAKLRRWRARLEPGTEFVFRRSVVWGRRRFAAGDVVPDEIKNSPKLKSLWERRFIEMRDDVKLKGDAAPPPPAAAMPDGVKKLGGSWYAVSTPGGDVKKVQGKDALDALLAEVK